MCGSVVVPSGVAGGTGAIARRGSAGIYARRARVVRYVTIVVMLPNLETITDTLGYDVVRVQERAIIANLDRASSIM